MLIKSIKTEVSEEMIEISLPAYMRTPGTYSPYYYYINNETILVVCCDMRMIFMQDTTQKTLGDIFGKAIPIEESEFLAAYVTAKANLDLPIIQKEAI